MDLTRCDQGAWQFEVIHKKSYPCLDAIQHLVIVHDVLSGRDPLQSNKKTLCVHKTGCVPAWQQDKRVHSATFVSGLGSGE